MNILSHTSGRRGTFPARKGHLFRLPAFMVKTDRSTHMAMPHTILLILLFLLTSFAQAATTRAELLVHFAKDKSVLDARAIAQLDSFITTLTIEGDYTFTVHG